MFGKLLANDVDTLEPMKDLEKDGLFDLGN